MRQKDIQALISCYLDVEAAYNTVVKRIPRGDWKTFPMPNVSDFLWRAKQEMAVFCEGHKPATWALDVVPPWAAAGLRAGVMEPSVVPDATTLIMFAGMEQRRYVSSNEAKVIIASVVGTDNYVNESQVKIIGKEIDRQILFKKEEYPIKRDDVYLWATKRRHSEFLRRICLKLGDWIAEDPLHAYYGTYERCMGIEVEKKISLTQAEARAKTAAVRDFLKDYWLKMEEAKS